MDFSVIKNADVTYVDEMLWTGHDARALPADELRLIPQAHISLWCLQRGVYTVPSIELIDFLKAEIGEQSAIEVGAGCSGIGKALGIKATDLYAYERTRAAYERAGQGLTIPPSYVERIDGNLAIEKYKPDVVIGGYITQRWREGDSQGLVWGIDESKFLGTLKYITIGNTVTHGWKRLVKTKPREVKADWLITRHPTRTNNRIWICEKG